MTDLRKPRAGSLAFRPRKRIYHFSQRVRTWPKVNEVRPLGFIGFKVGMTTVGYVKHDPTVRGGKLDVYTGATIVEAPPMVVYGIRYYNGRSLGDELAEDKEILSVINAKNYKKRFDYEKNAEKVRDVRLLVYAQPKLTTIGQKHVERAEIAIGGSLEEKLKFAREILGKELKISDVFKEGQYVDVIGVTKGKGWQGEIKRFGVSKQRRKATGKVRHVGTLGPFHPPYVMYTVPRAGQTGLHRRKELNKLILKIGSASEVDEINPSSGFPHYGVVRNDFVVLKGSIPGPAKRFVFLVEAIRPPKTGEKFELKYISREPKN